MRFIFDNCLSSRIAYAVGALSGQDRDHICHLTDRFKADESDQTWIGELAKEENWVIISGDIRIIRSKHQRRALRELKAVVFCLSPSWMKFKLWDQAWRLIRRWPEIDQQASLVQQGALFEIPVKPTARFRQLPD